MILAVAVPADTVPPTASVIASASFTNALNVSVTVSFSKPCPGGGGFRCSSVDACNVSRWLNLPFIKILALPLSMLCWSYNAFSSQISCWIWTISLCISTLRARRVKKEFTSILQFVGLCWNFHVLLSLIGYFNLVYHCYYSLYLE